MGSSHAMEPLHTSSPWNAGDAGAALCRHIRVHASISCGRSPDAPNACVRRIPHMVWGNRFAWAAQLVGHTALSRVARHRCRSHCVISHGAATIELEIMRCFGGHAEACASLWCLSSGRALVGLTSAGWENGARSSICALQHTSSQISV